MYSMDESLDDFSTKIENTQWLKERLSTIWSSTKFCGICLNSSSHLNSVDMEFIICRQKSSQSFVDILNYLFNDNIANIMCSTHICDQCTEKTLRSYLFIRNSRQLSKIILKCLKDIDHKVIEISERVLENVDCENSNVMLVLEDDAELFEEIDSLTAATEIVPTNRPITKIKKQNVSPETRNVASDLHIYTSFVNKEYAPVDKRFVNTYNVGNKLIGNINTRKHAKKDLMELTKNAEPAASNIQVQEISGPQDCARSSDTDASMGVELVTKITENNVKINERTADLPKEETAPIISLEKGKIVVNPIKTSFDMPFTPKYTTYKCKECPDIFTTHKSLREHEKSKHMDVKYQCEICDKIYISQQYLNSHYKFHSKTRCRLCTDVVNDDYLSNHLRQNHPNLIYACNFCELVYYSEDDLLTHFKTAHLVNYETSNSKCEMCLKEIHERELKLHRCKFGCPECLIMPCIHYDYLISYRKQVLNYAKTVKCIDCDYETHRKEYLIGHVNREHLDHHPFVCNDCGMQFYTKMKLKNHINQYHFDNICEYCDKEFKKPKVLPAHTKKCKKVKREFPCLNCKASFDIMEDYVKHHLLRHNNGGYPCNLCHRRFLEEVQLEEHQVMAHSQVQFKKRRRHIECTLCDIRFKSIKELMCHEDTHTPGTEYPCTSCDRSYSSLKQLYSHQARHFEKVACRGCKQKIIPAYYAQHEVRCPYLRNPGELHICEVCGKMFAMQSSLERHRKCHEPVECTLCGKSVKGSSLHAHMNYHLGLRKMNEDTKNPPKFACEICGHLSRTMNDFDCHMNRFHLKVKPYKCNVCNKTFCGKHRLKNHLSTHSTNNSCFCSTCGKKFANKACLKDHMKIHTGELPFSCDLCKKKCRTSSLLQAHKLKKHTVENVPCPGCDLKFHIVRQMRRHFKLQHWKSEDNKPFNAKEVVNPKYLHLFEDRRNPIRMWEVTSGET